MATEGTDLVRESDGSYSKQVRMIGGSGGSVAVSEIAAGDNNIGNVDVASIAAGTNKIGKVGADVTTVTGTTNGANTVAAAGDYAALDILAHSASNGVGVNWIWSNAAAVAGGSGTITRVLIRGTAETMTARIRIWLFNAATTTATEMDDNAAFLLDEDDYGKLLGWIDMPAMARAGASGEPFVTQNIDVRFAFACNADAHLYGILQLLDAETLEAAGMSIFPVFQITRD